MVAEFEELEEILVKCPDEEGDDGEDNDPPEEDNYEEDSYP